MKPRVQEIAGTLPARLGQWTLESPRLTWWLTHLTGGKQIRTSTVSGFLLLYALAGLRRWRRNTSRYREENIRIEAWLARIEQLAPDHHPLAVELARAQRLIKGYGETHERRLKRLRSAGLPAGCARGPARRRGGPRQAAGGRSHGRGRHRARAGAGHVAHQPRGALRSGADAADTTGRRDGRADAQQLTPGTSRAATAAGISQLPLMVEFYDTGRRAVREQALGSSRAAASSRRLQSIQGIGRRLSPGAQARLRCRGACAASGVQSVLHVSSAKLQQFSVRNPTRSFMRATFGP